MRAPVLVALALLAPALPAQDTPPPDTKKEAKKEEKKELAPLPEGQTKIFEAIVIEVEGTAQARATAEDAWKKLALNDVLKPGVVIRTGRESHVTLRVGPNATMLVDRQSRVTIPEIVQEGAVLRTRVQMSLGKTDVRVDRIGLDNDFEVATPTATLAVRGTTFRITWDAVAGFEAIGVPGNKLRAIEIKYLDGVEAFLSKADASSDTYQLPAIHGFYETYFLPLKGAVGSDELGDPTQSSPERVSRADEQTGLKAAQKARGAKGQGRTGNQLAEEDK